LPLNPVFDGPIGGATMTPDGVSTEDWDRVHELAVHVVNATTRGEEEASAAATRQILTLLDDLDGKYGPLPSLLATRADYVEKPSERERLWEAAHEQAVSRGDRKNLVWIATSLAEFHLTEANDHIAGRAWVERAERYLRDSPDASEEEGLKELRRTLDGQAQ
jgi:hypothetical protein